MDQATQPRVSGFYTANLLGNIRSHLAGLQGYDVMALELIRNADDAKAEKSYSISRTAACWCETAASSPTVATWISHARFLPKATTSAITTP